MTHFITHHTREAKYMDGAINHRTIGLHRVPGCGTYRAIRVTAESAGGELWDVSVEYEIVEREVFGAGFVVVL